MSAKVVPAALLREVLDEMEQDCTVERFHEWYRRQVAAEIHQTVPRPKADKWDIFGNRTITYRFNEACTNVVRRMWASHRKLVRERIEAMIATYEVQRAATYGDILLMEAGGSIEEMVTWMLKQSGSTDGHMPRYKCGEGTCPCAFRDRAEERMRKQETARALLSGDYFAQWVSEQIDELAKDEPVVGTTA